MELMQANHQWATRPGDERFTSLNDMQAHFAAQREASREVVVSSRKIEAVPATDNQGLIVRGPNGHDYAPTHFAFGQLALLAKAPAGYLRTLPSPVAADCLNYGLQFKRDIEDVGCLLYRNGTAILRAATGPRYGRIWNNDCLTGLVEWCGDGVTGRYRVPAEFGVRAPITKENTTLYASDRDFWVFLADEDNRIEVPDRRQGRTGSLARGFFMWTSEVGDRTFGVGTFLYDYMCGNHIIWGAEQYKQVTIRHTAGAPDKWLEQVRPALKSYTEGSADTIIKAVADARAARLDNVGEWLAKRYGAKQSTAILDTHLREEGRPIETLWDVSTGLTAVARDLKHTDARVDMEREAGRVIDLAAA